jgi:hypothetical protein
MRSYINFFDSKRYGLLQLVVMVCGYNGINQTLLMDHASNSGF